MILGGDRYIWLVWALAFLIPWASLYVAFPGGRIGQEYMSILPGIAAANGLVSIQGMFIYVIGESP